LGVRRIGPRRAGRQGRYRSIKLQELGVGVDVGRERRFEAMMLGAGAKLKRKAWAEALNLARVN
jgi:hypothetical protein